MSDTRECLGQAMYHIDHASFAIQKMLHNDDVSDEMADILDHTVKIIQNVYYIVAAEQKELIGR